MEYTVSMRVDARVDVKVNADSFAEAFEKASHELYDSSRLEVVEYVPVNAEDEYGKMKDYNG